MPRFEDIDYTKLPPHCQQGMRAYIEEGRIPGRFLQAVICNLLVESWGRADDTNQHALSRGIWQGFIYNEMPTESWGSEEKMRAWSLKMGAKRTAGAIQQALVENLKPECNARGGA